MLVRQRRAGCARYKVAVTDASESFSRLDTLAPNWMEIEPSDEVREEAASKEGFLIDGLSASPS